MSDAIHGRIWWSELNTWDATAAMAYYNKVMGWEFASSPTAGTDSERPYYIAMKDGKPVAGVFTMVEPEFKGLPDHWFLYIAVADLQSAIDSGQEEGGTLIRPPFEIPGFGKLAIVRDSTGAAFAMIEPVRQS